MVFPASFKWQEDLRLERTFVFVYRLCHVYTYPPIFSPRLQRRPLPPHGQGQQTKTNIIDTALHIATHHGLESLSIGGWPEATSMSKSGVFAHFGSREELQISVVREYHHRFEQEVYPALQAEKACRACAPCSVTGCSAPPSKVDSGCLYISGAVEFSEREGAVRDALVASFNTWHAALRPGN